MIRVPGVNGPPVTSDWSSIGINLCEQVTDKMVEFVDILPTLVEAAGFPPVDKCPIYSRNVTFCRWMFSGKPGWQSFEGKGWAWCLSLVVGVRARMQCSTNKAEGLYSVALNNILYDFCLVEVLQHEPSWEHGARVQCHDEPVQIHGVCWPDRVSPKPEVLKTNLHPIISTVRKQKNSNPIGVTCMTGVNFMTWKLTLRYNIICRKCATNNRRCYIWNKTNTRRISICTATTTSCSWRSKWGSFCMLAGTPTTNIGAITFGNKDSKTILFLYYMLR